jgi:hypothetical protein
MWSRGGRRSWHGLVLVLAWLGAAAEGAQGPARLQGASNPVAQPPARVRFVEGASTETRAARERRLRRECRGRPNAGACLGLTR